MRKLTCFVFAIALLQFAGCSSVPSKRQFVAAGTYLEVTSSNFKAAGIVYNEFKRLEKIFSFYDKGSDLSRVNNNPGSAVKVSPEFIEVLNLAADVTKMTNGGFDISYGALYAYWKKLIAADKFPGFPGEDQIARLKNSGGMDKILIDRENNTVTLTTPGVKLDLAAIAKGYMVDKAAEKLNRAGIANAVINAGGDIYCMGNDRGRPWKVGIKNPGVLSDILAEEKISDEAIATSGDYEQFFEYNGKRYSHLIDPRSGYPVDNGVVSVTVIAKNCTTADSLATAFSILGPKDTETVIHSRPSTLRLFIVTEIDGEKNIQIIR